MSMHGCIVRHETFGLGKIVETSASFLRIRFPQTKSDYCFSPGALGSTLLHPQLEVGFTCFTDEGPCRINRCVTDSFFAPREYEVECPDGRVELKTETELLIAENADREIDAAKLLAAREIDSYTVFRAREDFQQVHIKNLRNLGMHRALLSSRIDLHPHQVSVALTILGDTRKRYILADEVGLGKTIEAGIVIHELLAARPNARVLIVCPGTLTQQWLCEIYSKFGGRVFTLLDLYPVGEIPWRTMRSAIVSTSRTVGDLGDALLTIAWDLVVIDEAHHLLGMSYLYDFALALSRRTPWILLLSALPAQRREDEFLRLLRLLEPERYEEPNEEDLTRFRQLFDLQREVGRALKLLRLRTEGFRAGEFTTEQLVQQLHRTVAHDCFRDDSKLARLAKMAQDDPMEVERLCEEVATHISNNYRINRRILRNRRQELLDRGELEPVQRKVELHGYDPGPYESEALAAIGRLLNHFWQSRAIDIVKSAFAQTLLQSLASPALAQSFLQRTLASEPASITAKGEDFLGLAHILGYEDSKRYEALLRRSARGLLETELLEDCLGATVAWNRFGERENRVNQLRLLISEMHRLSPNCKLLIFAGFPGLASEIATNLRNVFGSSAITQFTYDLPREAKEDAARQFADNRNVWVMVSDESGGEGRNFQFASSVVHFDHPWHVSRIEQRIGRLDRLERAKFYSDVTSHLIFCKNAVEEALIRCYGDGLGVYKKSISGLEFEFVSAIVDMVCSFIKAVVYRLHQAAIRSRTATALAAW